jgi:hypothetical protein
MVRSQIPYSHYEQIKSSMPKWALPDPRRLKFSRLAALNCKAALRRNVGRTRSLGFGCRRINLARRRSGAWLSRHRAFESLNRIQFAALRMRCLRCAASEPINAKQNSEISPHAADSGTRPAEVVTSEQPLVSIVPALKNWIGTFRSQPDREDEARSPPRPAQPGPSALDDEALDDALDDVMARFAKALEHLAK